MNSIESLQPELDRLERRFLWAGVIALALCIVGAFFNTTQFFRSYLLAYVFWIGFPLGCVAILMLHHMVGGNWGFAIRRLLESGSRTFGWMALLFIPLLVGLFRFHLYKWSGWSAADHPYLNVRFFIVRAALYFLAWILLTYFLNKWSLDQDRTGDPGILSRLQSLSGPGLLIYGLTITYASVDWVMSLEPEWFSTIYGMMFMVSEALAAMSFITIVITLLADHEPLAKVTSPYLFNDYGNLLLTFTMLWAYLSFSQFLIIWSGNLQDEIPWYVTRATGGWAWVALFLIVFHFAVPFVLLLSRFVKRRMQWLAAVAGLLLGVSLLDMYWLVVPAFDSERAGPHFHWMDWVAALGIGGIWVAAFLAEMKSRPLVPLHDPRFEGVLSHGH